jgi:hypothetical protein
MMKIVDVEFNQCEVENSNTKFESGRVISKISIPIEIYFQKTDAVLEISEFEKKGKFPSIVSRERRAEPDHIFHPDSFV